MNCKHLQSINSIIKNEKKEEFFVYNCEIYGICTKNNLDLLNKDGDPIAICQTCDNFIENAENKNLKMQECNCAKSSLAERIKKQQNT